MNDVMVYATTSMVIPVKNSDSRRFVMVQERDTLKWNQPGGGLNPHDRSYIDACAREVKEETGLVVVPTYFVGIYCFDSLHGNRVMNVVLASDQIEQSELGKERDKDILDVRLLTLEQITGLHSANLLRSGAATLGVVEDYIRAKGNDILIPVNSVMRSY